MCITLIILSVTEEHELKVKIAGRLKFLLQTLFALLVDSCSEEECCFCWQKKFLKNCSEM